MSTSFESDFQEVSDAALWHQILEKEHGWEKAYDHLIHKRYGAVLKHAKATVEFKYGVELEWRGVCNEVFLSLYGKKEDWKNLRSWDSTRPMAGWLWVLTRNLCYRIARKEYSLQKSTTSNTGEELEHLHAVSGKNRTETQFDEIIAFDHFLSMLKDPCERILRLKYFGGFTDAEIGKKLNITREWANQKRRSCLGALAKILEDQGIDSQSFYIS